ncbi:MAG TPA: hypothetical protein VFA59_11885 [Vicinamibacterales bacterium]|nr:hypothetical protein [Vicinamibacterales bacterium]
MNERVDTRVLEQDLKSIFGTRLVSIATYAGQHSLVIVDTLHADDLRACAKRVDAWHDAHLATPLVLAAHEFEDALDAFPLEFGAILADHTVTFGKAPFDGLTVDPADLRRAIEVQARSHLLHLREGLIETRGRSDALSLLITDSAAAFSALLTSVARLDRSFDAGPVAKEVAALAGHHHDLGNADAERLFPGYLDAVERLVKHIDTWSA